MILDRLAVLIVILVLLIGLADQSGAVKAQERVSPCMWSIPINLSESPDTNTLTGAAIGDRSGYVHALWTERTDAEPGDITNYLIYRFWDGRSWSPPADILVTAGYADALVADAALSPDQSVIFIVWTDGVGVNVSSAARHRAADAQAWRTVRVAAGGTLRPAMVVDNLGHVHVIYTDYLVGSNAMRHVKSEDGGKTWSIASDIWLTPASDRAFDYARLIVDHAGVLHAAWQVGEKDKEWVPFSVLYTQSTDDGETWAQPVEFQSYERGYANPELLEDSKHRVHLFINGAAGTLNGRFHTWSADGGRTWAPMQQLLGYYTGGRSGFSRLMEDASGTLNAVMAVGLQTGDFSQRTVVAQWKGAIWGPPAVVPGGYGGDAPSAALTTGNQLHVFMWTQKYPAEIMYSTCLLPAPTIPPVPTPDDVVQALPTAVATQTTKQAFSAPAATVTLSFDNEGAPTQRAPQVQPVLLAAILSGTLVLAVVVLSTTGKKRLRF